MIKGKIKTQRRVHTLSFGPLPLLLLIYIYIYIYIERERERERERNTEQWNLRNIGPRLYKVVNEVDSLYSGPLPLTYALRAF
jgi:hypothetical protein